jgi:asparagine synthase (glutamine-hydrolysing)
MGADEVLAGYPRHVATIRALKSPLLRITGKILSPIIRGLSSKNDKWNAYLRRAKFFSKNAGLPFEQMYLGLSTYFSPEEQRRLLTRTTEDFGNDVEIYSMHHSYFGKCLSSEPLNRLLYVDLKTFLPCLNLQNMDKTSMAHGVEMRVPFLDDAFLDFTSSLPVSYKLNGITRKHILRKAYQGIIPDSIITRPKTGFSIPIRKWIKDDLNELLADTIFSKRFIERGIFDQTEVLRLHRANQRGVEDNSIKLWQLLVFDLWMKIFIEDFHLPSLVDLDSLHSIS